MRSVLLTVVIAASLLVIKDNVIPRAESKNSGKSRQPVTITAGSAHFVAPRELLTGEPPAAAQPVALTSADFNSDGLPDLVTADETGTVHMYAGNPPSQSLTSPAQETDPFTLTPTIASLGFSPSVLAAGDFDADGRPDVAAAAAGTNALAILSGDGHGKFTLPRTVQVAGIISAIAAGEIGRKDGQADLAVAVQNEKGGALLFVYEHPEGAFKHQPEVFALPAPAEDIATGNLDSDFYADIAVACGDKLVIVHGRGQAYPWDLIPDSGIKRPDAVVETRQMSFTISALAVGRFGQKRGESLALLGSDGNIYGLEPSTKQPSSTNKLLTSARSLTTAVPFAPTGVEPRALATVKANSNPSAISAAMGLPSINTNSPNGTSEQDVKEVPRPDKETINKIMADGSQKKAAFTQRSKAAFLRSLEGKSSSLNQWQLETLVSGTPATGSPKLTRVNVSSSRLDELMITGGGQSQIQLAGKAASGNQFDVASLEVAGEIEAVLPLRLNADALSDLVVLRKGSAAPSIVISTAGQNFVVTSTTDEGDCIGTNPCSLRNAILLANANAGADFITFSFGGAPTTITPAAELPIIKDAVTMLGPTDGNNHPTVEISGANVPAPADGLKIRGGNVTIQSLCINRFQGQISGGSQIGGNGISIETPVGFATSINNWIIGNYLGTDLTGTLKRGNTAAGLNIFDSDENHIGVTVGPGGNVISGNGVGVALTAGNSNVFQGNIIGLTAAGNAKLGNSYGLFFSGANNAFGGDGPGEPNTVSGNGAPDQNNPSRCFGEGMYFATLLDPTTFELLTLNNTVKGNRFGTDPTGTQPLGNCYQAINTSPLHQTIIGSITPGGRNVIADNGFNAMACAEEVFFDSVGGFCAIAGNNIGTDITGLVPMPNNDRNYLGGIDRPRGTVDLIQNLSLSYFGAPGGTSANACTGFCNLYAANNPGVEEDIIFIGYGVMGFFNNFIGTNALGNQAMPIDHGIAIYNALYGQVLVGAVGKDANNAPISMGNLISGSSLGIFTFTYSANFPGAGYSSELSIQGNRFGTDASGIFAIPNQTAIFLARGYTEPNTIGGVHPLARNIISGNTGSAIYNGGNFLSSDSTIVNNLIGLNAALAPLGNGDMGIFLRSGFGAQIGGTDQEANQIAHNGTGVVVANGATGVKIRNNSIHHNTGLGIDLSIASFNGDGVTENDCQDLDSGSNDFQNYPLLDAPVFNPNGTVKVTGALLSRAFDHYTVDFYASSTANASGHGEGEKYLGSLKVSTDDHGLGPIDFTSAVTVPPSWVISATATDSFGSTSEFSCNAGATCSEPGSIAGKRDYKTAAAFCFTGEIVVTLASDEPNEPASKAANICDVFLDAQHPGNDCTLRAAIDLANDRKDKLDTILFNISGDGVHTITPTKTLPAITDPVTINGASQHGYNGSPLIEVSGEFAGLEIATNNSTIRGFAIFGARDQIALAGSGNKVQACYLGLRADGITVPDGDVQFHGISVSGRANTIGGDDDADGNVISGNTKGNNGVGEFAAGINLNYGNYDGQQLSPGAKNTIVKQNKIGTDSTGTIAKPNSIGVWARNAADSTGASLVENNLISGNSLDGIRADSPSILVKDNLIGATADGSAPLSNKTGINAGGTQQSLVKISGNTIVGNQGSDLPGVGLLLISGARFTIVENYIGVTKDGKKIPNDTGIEIANPAPGTVIGAVGQGNVIAGNRYSGISVGSEYQLSDEIVDVKIIGNFIGVNAANNDPNMGNGENGIRLQTLRGDGSLTTNILRTEIANNVISGNGQCGILLNERGNDSRIHDNQIGTPGEAAQPAIGNQIGIHVLSQTNHIYKNTITGNSGIGLLLGNTIPDPPATTKARSDAVSRISAQAAAPVVENNEVYSNQIEGNQVGIALTEGANNNIIGSKSALTAGLGNTIGGNTGGVGIGIFVGVTDFVEDDPDSRMPSGNKIVGNLIGTGDGGGLSPNRVGLVLYQAMNNLIGVTSIGNTIVANQQDGIRVGGFKTKGNQIFSNFVGALDMAPDDKNYGNGGDGIKLEGTERNDIKFNVIGWNQGNGLNIGGIAPHGGETFSSIVSGNQIGVLQSPNGPVSMGNMLIGIRVSGTLNLLIGVNGNSSSEPKNIVANNGRDGILLDGNSQQVLINNTIIGTDESGLASLGNEGDGIHIIGGNNNTIGGVASVGNVISGNQGNGLLVENSASNKLYGNRVGIFAGTNGNFKLGNGLNGVRIVNSSGSQIGATFLGTYRNFIGGNGIYGLLLEGAGTSNTLVKNNFIGTDQSDTLLGNISHGVLITNQAQDNVIGGQEIEAGNTIAHNGGGGIALDPSAGGGIAIDPNLIYGNGGLGIDLNADGNVQPNDPGDTDFGPNALQNYPVFDSALLVPGGNLEIKYKIDSLFPNSNYGLDGIYVEIFKADSSSHPQGQTFIASTHYTQANYDAGSPGLTTLIVPNAASLGIHAGDKLVATATDAQGNTSEFTGTAVTVTTIGPTATDGTVGGTIVDSTGKPVEGVAVRLNGTQNRLTITDVNGKYRFDDVETNGLYSIVPARDNYEFNPAQRAFSQLGSQTEATFTATYNSGNLNPLDATTYFVRQQYLDFLNREPDEAGFNFWVNKIESCGRDVQCREVARIDTSAAFFLSIEFQQTGFLVERTYKAAFGNLTGAPIPINLDQFKPDTAEIGNGVVVLQSGWEQRLAQNKQAFMNEFVQRPAFVSAFPASLSPAEFVDKLLANAGVSLSVADRATATNEFGNATDTADIAARGRALRQVAENSTLTQQEFNRAFVLMQYFGYLRRDPNSGQDTDFTGYNFWLNKLNAFGGNYQQAEMVKAFLVSSEYLRRFPR